MGDFFPPVMIQISHSSKYNILSDNMEAPKQTVTGGLKRQRDETDKTVESSSSPLSPTKQGTIHLENRFPYERLSKLFFTRRALRYFDQQTPTATFPSPPEPLQLDRLFPTLEELGIDRVHHLKSGGPGLGDLRGYFNPKESYPESYTPGSSDEMPEPEKRARMRKSSAYDQNFNQLFIDHGSFPVGHCHRDNRPDPEPANLEELNEVLLQRRPSLSPSCFTEKDFRDFWQKAKNRSGEMQVMGSVFPIIRGNAKIPYEEKKLFRNLDPFTEGIVIAKPDFYDGANPNDLDQQVREELGRYIVPSAQKDAPILPNFFAEGKGNEGSDAVAERQALYGGTLGARAIQRLQSYRKKSLVYDNKAYTIT